MVEECRASKKGAQHGSGGGGGRAGLLGALAFPHAFIHPTSWKLLLPNPKREKMSREELPEQFRKQSPTSRDSGAPRVSMSGSRAHKGDPSNVGASERFAEDAHKDQRWEGGVIGRELVESSS